MRPIVILGAPRSFTSLTAGIFRDHGVWFGQDMTLKIAPTGSCENQEIKKALREHKDGIVKKGIEAPPHKGWKDIVDRIKEKQGCEGRWGAKHSAMYWRVWEEYDPYFVCCRRDPQKILESNKRANFIDGTSDWLPNHIKVMEELVEKGAAEVWGEEFFKGDFEKLEKAFEYCELEFKPEIAERLIDEKHWHVR